MSRQFVRVGDVAIGNGAHGNKCCGHALTGRWVRGAPSVLTNGKQTIRANVDIGVHDCPHCGVMIPVGQISNVIIEGAPQHYKGGTVNFTCGTGITVTASENVL